MLTHGCHVCPVFGFITGIKLLINSFIQEFIRRPFKKSTQRRHQPNHGDTDQS